MLVSPELCEQFILVGSGAMLYHGHRHRGEDIDIVGTAAALWSFLEAARKDDRFSVEADGGIVG